jgi:hypothetical protein
MTKQIFTIQVSRAIVTEIEADSYFQACEDIGESIGNGDLTQSILQAESIFECLDQRDVVDPEPKWTVEEILSWNIAVEAIGDLKNDFGSDRYYLLRNRNGDAFTPEMAEAFMLPLVYKEGSGAGLPFCHVVNAVQSKNSDSSCLVTVEYRLDIWHSPKTLDISHSAV